MGVCTVTNQPTTDIRINKLQAKTVLYVCDSVRSTYGFFLEQLLRDDLDLLVLVVWHAPSSLQLQLGLLLFFSCFLCKRSAKFVRKYLYICHVEQPMQYFSRFNWPQSAMQNLRIPIIRGGRRLSVMVQNDSLTMISYLLSVLTSIFTLTV